MRSKSPPSSTPPSKRPYRVTPEAVVQGCPIAQFVIDRQHRVLHWNKAMEELTGVLARELVGTQQHWKAFYPSERPCLCDLVVDGAADAIPTLYQGKHEISELIEDAWTVTAFFEHLGAGGAWIRFTSAPIRDRTGAILGAIETIQDITPLKRAEADALEERNKAQRYLDVAPGLFVVIGPDQCIQLVNHTAAELIGSTAAQMAGKNWFLSCVPARVRQQAIADFERLKAGPGDTGQSHEARILTTRGQERLVAWRTSVVRGDDQQFLYAVFAGDDITDRTHTEQLLRQSEERFRQMANNVGDIIWTTDMNLRFTFISPSVFRVRGLTVEEAMRQSPEQVLTAESMAHARTLLAEGMAELLRGESPPGRTWSAEWQEYHKDGSIIWTENELSFLRDAAGQVTGIVGVTRDISARKQAQAERAKLEAQLQQAQKMEAIGRLAGGVAHDFNNILTVITGNAEMVLGSPGMEPSDAEAVRQILDAARRAAALTQQLLAFSRKQIISPRVVSLDDVVVDLTKMLSRLVGEDIELIVRGGARPGLVNADPHQLDQILVNLAVNARDAMPDGGKLTIETSHVRLDESYRALHPETVPGDYVLLSVSDTGLGMDADTLSRVFEPFFTSKTLGNGTGLGLATVYGIVQQNAGSIDVHSEPGVGSTFRVYFPLSSQVPSLPVPAQPARTASGTETVLLVEDDPMIRKLTSRLLRSHHYTVLEAGRGDDALQVAAGFEGEIQLLIADVIMPGMDGRTLSEKLRSARPAMKVLFMSGYTDDIIIHRGVQQEDTSFIAKPFGTQSLVMKVREVLERS